MSGATMRALVCESWREWDQLELKQVPRPVLRPGGVRLRIAAVGVSFAAQLVVNTSMRPYIVARLI